MKEIWCLGKKHGKTQSIGVSKLQSPGLVLFKRARPILPKSVNTLLINHRRTLVVFNYTYQGRVNLSSKYNFQQPCLRITSSSKSASRWLLVGLVTLFQCLTAFLKTLWAFRPHTIKRFWFWKQSIFTWSSHTTQMHKHFFINFEISWFWLIHKLERMARCRESKKSSFIDYIYETFWWQAASVQLQDAQTPSHFPTAPS